MPSFDCLAVFDRPVEVTPVVVSLTAWRDRQLYRLATPVKPSVSGAEVVRAGGRPALGGTAMSKGTVLVGCGRMERIAMRQKRDGEGLTRELQEAVYE